MRLALIIRLTIGKAYYENTFRVFHHSLYTEDGKQTPFASLEAENRALKRENAELALERDMLKKAAAYFASLQK